MKKSKTRKKTSLSVIVLTLILVAVLGFCTYWIATNFETVKSSLDGTKLYTQEEITEAYNKGVADRKNFENEINEWISKYEISELAKSELQIQINEKQDLINQKQEELNNALSTNESLEEDMLLKQSEIDALVNELALLENEYNELLKQYAELENNSNINNKLIESINSNNQYVITYYYNGLNFALITKGSTLANVLPELDGESYGGWYYYVSANEKGIIKESEIDTYIPTSNLILKMYIFPSTLPIE